MLFGGVAVASLLVPSSPVQQLTSSAPAFRLALLLLIALVIGVLLHRRSWIAAGGAYVVGITIWVVVWLRPSPPWAPSDVWFAETWTYFLLVNVLLSALLFAGVAAIAEFIARTLRRRMAHAS